MSIYIFFNQEKYFLIVSNKYISAYSKNMKPISIFIPTEIVQSKDIAISS